MHYHFLPSHLYQVIPIYHTPQYHIILIPHHTIHHFTISYHLIYTSNYNTKNYTIMIHYNTTTLPYLGGMAIIAVVSNHTVMYHTPYHNIQTKHCVILLKVNWNFHKMLLKKQMLRKLILRVTKFMQVQNNYVNQGLSGLVLSRTRLFCRPLPL